VYGHAGIDRTDPEFRSEISEFNEQISNPARRAQREAEVTPGHTPTNVSVYVPADGLL
jgi:hypothetical protein